ncbi:MAG: hypothetical protein MPJ24_01825, partial [Pirellulaceae bacterium]|nr:hypothetical protein [Pirellulaceae bacterium]
LYDCFGLSLCVLNLPDIALVLLRGRCSYAIRLANDPLFVHYWCCDVPLGLSFYLANPQK